MNPLLLADHRGLVFLPRRAVAMVREEHHGRVEVLAADGTVAHRPGPLSVAEFVAVAPGVWVNPAFSGARLPGGWEVPHADGELEPEPPDPSLGGFRASEVLYLRAERPPAWVTDRGEVPCPGRGQGKRLARLHPRLVAAGRNFYVNPLRLRWLRKVDGTREYDLGFDQGSVLRLSEKSATLLARGLGLASRYEVGGETDMQRLLLRLGVQRWPVELAMAPAARLRAEFADAPVRLVANLAWQTWEARRLGVPSRDGRDHRGYFYLPVKAALQRAGHLGEDAGEPGPLKVPRLLTSLPRPRLPMDADSAFAVMCEVLTVMVESGLLTYRELGFRERLRHHRGMGATRPDVVLFVEKDSLLEPAFELHRRFGVTVYVSGGLPALVGAEFLCEDLRALGVGEVLVVSYCDHDVVGHELPVWFAAQLARYGVGTRGIRRMITPDLFTAEEIERLAVPIRTSGPPQWRARVRRWLEETGGVNGRALALYANVLQPLERVVAAFERVVGQL